MIWEVDSEFECMQFRSKAKEYYDEHGNLDMSRDYITWDGFKLGEWVYEHKYIKKGSGSLV